MRKPKAITPSPLRQRYIDAGHITPDPYLNRPRLTSDEMDEQGFHAAAAAARNNPVWSRAR